MNNLSNIENNSGSDNNSIESINLINSSNINNNNYYYYYYNNNNISNTDNSNNIFLDFLLYTDQTENRHASTIPSKFNNKNNNFGKYRIVLL